MKIKPALKNLVLGWFGVDGAGTVAPGLAATSSSGAVVTDYSVMQLSAVWACVRLISETVATLPLGVYERVGRGKRYAPQHPLHFIIHNQPNTESTASVFWTAVVAAMLLRGNAFCEKLMIGSRLVGLRFLAPNRLFYSKLSDGTLQYWYTNDDGSQRQIPTAMIWRVPGFTLDGKWGVSVIEYGAQVFGAAQSADTAASKMFDKGLMPTTAISYPKVMKPEQRAAMREEIQGLGGAINAGRPVILEAEMSIQSVGIAAKDAQLLESRGYSVEEICRWFGVPPFMVGHSEKSTSWGTGIEQQMQGFLTFTLSTWLKRIEEQIDKDLLTPGDRLRYYSKHSVDGLLRADSAGRAAYLEKMVKSGIYTPDEAREYEDLEVMGGNAAKLQVNAATTLLDALSDTPPEPGGLTQ